MGRAKSEQVAQQQEADMALEDKVQAAVERHVTAACAGHAQELENVRLQMQQSLDARAKEAAASSAAYASEKGRQDKCISALQEEVGQQYSYIERLEALLASMQPDRLSSHLRADLQLLHLGKPLPWEGQRLAALKARSAVAARCQRACQGSSEAAKSMRPFTAPVRSSPLSPSLATLPHLLSQPSEMSASWSLPPSPTPQSTPAASQDHAVAAADAAEQAAARQQLHDQQQLIQKLEGDVARYRAGMQEGHTKSRSLAVAMQSLQRQQAQKQWGLPFHQHGKQCQQAEHAASPPGSAGKHQCGLSREQVQRRRPMTASSILQNRTGRPASILATPGSASGRSPGSTGSLWMMGHSTAIRPVSARAKEIEAMNAWLP
ncbi:hypothetical protein ABBQ38_004297 [Trebouxia sp. C0009 RCD-2024]